MVKDFRTQFSFFTTGTIEKTVINDEYILTRGIGKILDPIVNDVCGKE